MRRGIVFLAAGLCATLATAQPLPAAPASGAKSVQGGSVDRFADALLYAAAERESDALARIRTLTMDLDDGVVFWRVEPPEAPLSTASLDVGPPAWPYPNCATLGPDLYFHQDVFCLSVLRFLMGNGDGDDSDDGTEARNPYQITYNARSWSGRETHSFTVTGARGLPLASDMESYEMWIDAETLTLVLFRSTGSPSEGEPAFTFSFERSDLRQVKGLTVPHHFRYTLYGAAPMFVSGFSPEEHVEMELVREALDAPDPDLAVEALPVDVRESVGFYAAILGNQPLEMDYNVRSVRVNQPLPAGVFGGFGR